MIGLYKDGVVWLGLTKQFVNIPNLGPLSMFRLAEAHGQDARFAEMVHELFHILLTTRASHETTNFTGANEYAKTTFRGLVGEEGSKLTPYHYLYTECPGGGEVGTYKLVGIRAEWLEFLRPVLGWGERGVEALSPILWRTSPEVMKIGMEEYVKLWKMIYWVLDTKPSEEVVLAANPLHFDRSTRTYLHRPMLEQSIATSATRRSFKYVLGEGLDSSNFKKVLANLVEGWADGSAKGKVAKKVLLKYAE